MIPIVVNIRASSLVSGMRASLSLAAIIVLTLDEYLKFASVREAALAALLTCVRLLGARSGGRFQCGQVCP